ncbi:hypothetical protein [Chitinophaga barathri]|uniref:Uncharacterized protein n=1 Tax=Chitinophaga barathri TaxID=1647451 RepID=A0A3N4M753_9BACT|nr:hypothetical protein [Chitinophaga barathri]RPD39232.1 hypothetical protein EG028_21720 [Chitinophaga barathri]
MKRSLVFLGLCLALGTGLTIAKEAKSAPKAAASVCCSFNTTRCQYGPLGWDYGPRVASWNDCVEF